MAKSDDKVRLVVARVRDGGGEAVGVALKGRERASFL